LEFGKDCPLLLRTSVSTALAADRRPTESSESLQAANFRAAAARRQPMNRRDTGLRTAACPLSTDGNYGKGLPVWCVPR
jgi:hypothetical protein